METVEIPQLQLVDCGHCRSHARRCAMTGAEWFRHPENCEGPAVAVRFLVVGALLCRSCLLCPLFFDRRAWFRLCRIRGGAAVAVPSWLWTSLCLCSDTLSRDSEGATDSVHRRSQWTFQSPQNRYAQFQLCMAGLTAMRGSLLQVCSIFRPPSFRTLRPRVAGTPGV